jgi:hypothetical protein
VKINTKITIKYNSIISCSLASGINNLPNPVIEKLITSGMHSSKNTNATFHVIIDVDARNEWPKNITTIKDYPIASFSFKFFNKFLLEARSAHEHRQQSGA